MGRKGEAAFSPVLFAREQLSVLLSAEVFCAPADYKSEVQRMEFHFRLNDTTLRSDCLGNGAVMSRLDSLLRSDAADSVLVVSKSSPEGPYLHNLRLSEGRANAVRSWLLSNYPGMEGRVRIEPGGESWDELRDHVADDTALPAEAIGRALAVIDAQGISVDTRKWRMCRLPEYRYISRKYFPLIRNSVVLVLRSRVPDTLMAVHVPMPEIIWDEDAPLDNALGGEVDEGLAPRIFVTGTRERISALAVKTNLLYDVATAVNVEVEVPIGRRWSVAAEDMFPWWSWGPHGNKYALQCWQMGIEGRWWTRAW